MRGRSQLRESTLKRKQINPVWRGIGCITLVALTVGGYFLAGMLLDLNQRERFLPFSLPPSVGWAIKAIHVPGTPTTFGPYFIPASLLVQLMVTLVVALLLYTLLTILYSALNPVRLGETDAPPVRRKITKKQR